MQIPLPKASAAIDDAPAITWFESLGWRPFDFQREAWQAYHDGADGLVHAPTGMGKTYAVWLGPLLEEIGRRRSGQHHGGEHPPGDLRVVWITPLRALASDTAESLHKAIEGLGLDWRVEIRTGDTASSTKQRQRRRLPHALITTPESLSLLLGHEDSLRMFGGLRAVVVDEWHELLSSKRGVQTELCLARLRRLAPEVRTWGLSATLGNLPEALAALTAPGTPDGRGRLIRGVMPKATHIRTLLPPDVTRFPWAGHLGTTMVPAVVEALEQARSTLLFTNTRSQAELWFEALLDARPDWATELALHHGSLDRDLRGRIEQATRQGLLRCVVCTSSLDLGVDFTPVDQVIQVGSPKGIARLLQRAGRSGHQPGGVSRILGVPTHAFELLEFAAAREAALRHEIEPREPIIKPLDLLAQHLLTLALAGALDKEDAWNEVRQTHAFRDLTRQEWTWVLDFLQRGGPALEAYPAYARLVEQQGRLHVASKQVARMHRMSVGTIASDASVQVKFTNGRKLGTVEEAFAARLRPGDAFLFAGRRLECIRFHQMTLEVKPAVRARGSVPRWMGGKMPLSSQLAHSVQRVLREGTPTEHSPELELLAPLIAVQQRWSALPREGSLLIEVHRSREGHHAFVFPLAGRLVHEGLAALVAWRLARRAPRTFSTSVSDYGFELLSHADPQITPEEWRDVLAPGDLVADLLQCLNGTELARRQFREVARVAGLIFSGHPGALKSTRQIQASSSLLYDVLQTHDPGNMLLDQARREVLERQLEVRRLERTLARIAQGELMLLRPPRLTPFAFPIWAERIREQVTSEHWEDRVLRMVQRLEAAAADALSPCRKSTDCAAQGTR